MVKITSQSMTPQHVKAARALLGCNAQVFSEVCSIGVATLRNFESGKQIKESSQKAIFDGLIISGITMKGGNQMGVEFNRSKGKWWINLNTIYCPKCAAKAPAFRKPDSIHQALWGGWSCSTCGCDMDKYGIEIN